MTIAGIATAIGTITTMIAINAVEPTEVPDAPGFGAVGCNGRRHYVNRI